MKINNPLSVLRAVSEALDMAEKGFENVMTEPQPDTKDLQQVSELVCNSHRLAEICLKLSDPARQNEKLTQEDNFFLANLYSEQAELMDQQDEEDEAEEQKEAANA